MYVISQNILLLVTVERDVYFIIPVLTFSYSTLF